MRYLSLTVKKKEIMQGFLCLLLTMVWMINFTIPADASAGKNLKDGLKTIVSSPKRIGQKISEEYEIADFKPFGIAIGSLKGLTYAFTDVLVGTARILTFPIEFDPEKKKSSWSEYTIFEGDVLPEKKHLAR